MSRQSEVSEKRASGITSILYKEDSKEELSVQARQFLEGMLQHIPEGFSVTDEDGNYMEVSNRYCDIVGYTREELLGHSYIDLLIPVGKREDSLKEHLGFLREGKPFCHELVLIKKSGGEITVRIDTNKLELPDGRLFRVTILRDISEEKIVRFERSMYSQALRDAIHPIVVTNTNGNITLVNDAFCKLYGYTREEVLGETTRILNPGKAVYQNMGVISKDYDQKFAEMWEHITNTRIGFWQGELYNRKRDGAIITVQLTISAIRDSEGNIVSYLGMPVDVTERRRREFNIRIECYRALNDLAATRDNETGGHLQRISLYCSMIAQHLQMPIKFIRDIEVFSPLHDIGKVGIADSILLAPRKLTKEEFEIMKTHATLGWQILRNRPTMEMAAQIAYSHHERWDGSGYPQALKGDDIPLAGRIMALADVYDALRSKRHYKPPLPHEEAVAYIYENSGSHFDPNLVEQFRQLEGGLKKMSESLQD